RCYRDWSSDVCSSDLDHLLGADGDGAALIDVSRAKRSVGSNKRNRARNRDLRDAGGLLGLCRGSAPTEREQGHEGRYKEGETPRSEERRVGKGDEARS